MIDWDALVLAPVHQAFDEPILYAPANGAFVFPLMAVYDDHYIPDTLDGGPDLTTVRPRLGVRQYYFTVAGQLELGSVITQDYALPLQDDLLYVPRVDAYYKVKEVRPDSKGDLHLELNQYGVDSVNLPVLQARFASLSPGP